MSNGGGGVRWVKVRTQKGCIANVYVLTSRGR